MGINYQGTDTVWGAANVAAQPAPPRTFTYLTCIFVDQTHAIEVSGRTQPPIACRRILTDSLPGETVFEVFLGGIRSLVERSSPR